MTTIKHQTSFEINRSAKELFPLFSAEGEKLWVPGWDYENIMGTTELHEDYIFLTSNHHRPDHHRFDHHGTTKEIWLVKRYEPSSYFVQFYMVDPYDRVGIVSVLCKPISEDLTEVEVTYEFVGLSEKGDDFIKGYTAEVFETSIASWPIWLEGYFEAKKGNTLEE
ncbi:hypothetical protein ACFLUX_02205 [Chloroflexota bacterium]